MKLVLRLTRLVALNLLVAAVVIAAGHALSYLFG